MQVKLEWQSRVVAVYGSERLFRYAVPPASLSVRLGIAFSPDVLGRVHPCRHKMDRAILRVGCSCPARNHRDTVALHALALHYRYCCWLRSSFLVPDCCLRHAQCRTAQECRSVRIIRRSNRGQRSRDSPLAVHCSPIAAEVGCGSDLTDT